MNNKKKIIYLGDFGNNWNNSFELVYKKSELIEITLNSLNNFNGIILMKNDFSSPRFYLGVNLDLEPGGSMPNSTIWTIDHLRVDDHITFFDSEKIRNKYPAYYQNCSLNMVTASFECSLSEDIEHMFDTANYEAPQSWKELFDHYCSAVEKMSLAYLQFDSSHNSKTIQAKLVLASTDLYDLKETSKRFREACDTTANSDLNNYKEYFYQKNEGFDFIKKLISFEAVEFKNDDAHRVIFDK